MPLTRTLTTGMTGDDVAALQKALRALDISVRDRDGDFRESTRRAVVLFQRGNRLRITGSFGPRELDTLVEKLGEDPFAELYEPTDPGRPDLIPSARNCA